MKNFRPKAWQLPQPVLIIGNTMPTALPMPWYLADDGKPDVEKMRLITFDPIHNGYIALGESRKCVL